MKLKAIERACVAPLLLFLSASVVAQSIPISASSSVTSAAVGSNAPALKHPPLFPCPPDPITATGCESPAVPLQKNVDEFWRRLISIIELDHGYVTPEKFEATFGVRFTKIEDHGDGHRFALLDGEKNSMALSVRLDVYSTTALVSSWQQSQGEVAIRRSILNIARGDFGCISLVEAEEKLTAAGLSLQGSIIYQPANYGKSITVFAGQRHVTTIMLFYDKGSITGPCVSSMRVIAHE
jgi:hypothetical protein